MYEKYNSELIGQQTTRPRLLRQRRDDLVILCIRHPGLCAEARMLLKPEHYNLPDEKAHQVTLRHLWQLIEGAKYDPGMVPQAALYDAIAQSLYALKTEELEQEWVGEIINDPSQPEWEGVAPGLIVSAYAKDMSEYDNAYAFETLKLFLEERAVADTAAKLVSSVGSRVPLKYARLLQDIVVAAERIDAIGSSPFSRPMPGDWQPKPLVRFPTGSPWVDDKLGGQVAGDVNGILGVFGGGKTTAMAQLVVGSGLYFLMEAEKTGRKPKVALMVSYEEREDMIRPRILSCAARISKTKLEEMKSLDELTRRGHLADYEIAMYREEGREDFLNLEGEYERFMRVTAMINHSIRIVDMRSGSRGVGGIEELAGYIRRFQEEEEVEIGVVCIDYVNAMCRRQINAEGKDIDRMLRHAAQGTPQLAEEKIANRFKCPVWLAQQFSGEANKKAPTAKMMMADASEARSFGENLVFCFGFGTTDPQTKCIQATCVKSRRRGMTGTTSLLRLEGDMARLVPADDRYEVEGNRIVDKRIKAKFEGPSATAKNPFIVDGANVANWG